MRLVHRLTTRVLVIAVVLLVPRAAGAQEALSRGSVLIGGTAGFNVEDENDAVDNITTITVAPAVEYFVADGFAVGGRLQLGYSWRGSISSLTYGIGPSASYYFVRPGDVHPFLRGSVRVARSTFDAEPEDIDVDMVGARAEAGLLFLLSESVGLDAALYFDRSHSEAEGNEDDVNNFGLAIGVAAFVF